MRELHLQYITDLPWSIYGIPDTYNDDNDNDDNNANTL